MSRNNASKEPASRNNSLPDEANIRNLRILTVAAVALLAHSVWSAFTRSIVEMDASASYSLPPFPVVYGIVVSALSAFLIVLAWQPSRRLLIAVRNVLSRRWAICLVVLIAIGLVAALSNPNLLDPSPLRRLLNGIQRRVVNLESLRQIGFPLVFLLVGAVVGPEGIRTASAEAEAKLGQVGSRLSSIKWVSSITNAFQTQPRLGSILGIAALACWLLWTFFSNQVYQTELSKDAAYYIYIGEHVWRGGIPYETVYYNHPPLQFVVGLLWSFLGRLTGLGVIDIARTYVLALGVGIIWLVYVVTRDLTGSKLSGLVAAIILVGSETQLLSLTVLISPNVKMSIVILILVGLWLAMHKHWFASGLALASASMLWLPAGALLAVLGIAALAYGKEHRVKAVSQAVLGAGLAFAVTAGVMLLLRGNLGSAYRQVIVSAFNTVGTSADRSISSGPARLTNYLRFLNDKWITDDLFILAITLTGIAVWLIGLKGRSRFASPDNIVVPLASFTMFILIFLDFQSFPDAFVFSSVACAFAGLAFASLDSLLRIRLTDTPISRRVLTSLVVVWLLLVSFSDILAGPTSHDRAKLESDVQRLSAVLGPDDKVQTLSALWFNIALGADNPTPYIALGTKYLRDIIPAEGKSGEDMASEIRSVDPAIIVVLDTAEGQGRLRPVLELLESRYVQQAHVWDSYIYVRSDRPDVQEAVREIWP